MRHTTQLLLHNPQALQVEFHVNEGRLILWWSPKAGSRTTMGEVATSGE